MHLERNTQVRAKVEKVSLIEFIEVEDDGEASAPQRYHTRRLVIGLRHVRLKVVFDVNSERLI